MMNLRVIFFGRKAPPIDEQVATYRRRIRQRWNNDEVILKAIGGRHGDPVRALAQEAENVRRLLGDATVLVALDEGGRNMDSEAFAETLRRFEFEGRRDLVFVIGSDIGLDPGLKREAQLRLSLSPMTLPHQIARLVLWEQLFRATHILGGGSYHRGRPI